MRVIIQRVTEASVHIEGLEPETIGRGLMVLVGISRTDNESDADYLANKVTALRVFPDGEGKMNRSVLDIGGELLLVSNFTLYGDTRKGRRPSFDLAAPPDRARQLYDYFVASCRKLCPCVKTGVFQAHMSVHLENDGPVTLICDSNQS